MAQPGRLSPQRMIPSEAEFPNGVSPRRRTALSIDRVGTKATELMGTARTRRGSLVPRPIGERTESPERSRMGRRMTRIKTQKFLGTDLRIPRGRAESLLYTYGEDDDLQPSSRRPSSLPGGLNSLESSGSGLGYYFKDKLKDLESAMQPELRNRALTEDLRRDLLALPKFKESKEMGHAVEEGYITEDFSRLIFDKFKNEAEPEFLQDLTLEVTGGLNMVAEIPLKEKYLWFIVLLVSVVFNVSYLLHLDWAIFKTYLTEVFGTFDPRLIADRLSNGGGSESRKEIQAQLLDDKSFKASIFGLISDQQTRMMIVNAAVMVAIWEVAWLCFQFVHALYLLGLVCLAKSEYKRFNAVGYFFQKLLPQVSTFSAVKLLARVHPSLLSHEYRIWVSESSEKLLCGHRRNTIGYVMLTITFVIFNICCAMASVSAFSVKMLAVSFKLVNPEVPTWLRLASILATLNQVVGAVYLERVLQDRIFLFVFGGRDATYEDDELAYRNAYETRLMKEIWVQYWHKKNPATGCRTWPQTALNALNAVVLLATLDHYDLQYLMVEDPEGEMDLFERLGLVESSQDAPQRSVSAPDDLSPSKRKKSNQSNVHKEKQDTSTCASLCNLLPCAAPVRVSSPELRAVPEESESPSPSRVNSPQGAESVVDAKDAFAGAVELVDETKQDAAVVPSAEPVDEADAFGPVCSEQDQQTCILTESVATHRPSWEPREDASESSQPLLCSEDGRIPPEHPNRVEDGESSVTSSRSGMEALTRLLGTAVGHWGDGWSETPQSRSRRSRHLAWGDGFSEMSRSETKESFDWDAMFSPQVRPTWGRPGLTSVGTGPRRSLNAASKSLE